MLMCMYAPIIIFLGRWSVVSRFGFDVLILRCDFAAHERWNRWMGMGGRDGVLLRMIMKQKYPRSPPHNNMLMWRPLNGTNYLAARPTRGYQALWGWTHEKGWGGEEKLKQPPLVRWYECMSVLYIIYLILREYIHNNIYIYNLQRNGGVRR